MARRLRLQFPHALYHVINRGNYRRPIFGTVGAAQAFATTLGEACERHAWRVHAYALIPNHFHVALETPEANLVDGMHWLQSTFATRFNRFRDERGHLFQGRYQALLVENAAHLVRLINYIHLNPVRAGLVPAADMARFRWSSLARFVHGSRPPWLHAVTLLEQLGLADSPGGWENYLAQLASLAAAPASREEETREFCTGWAIGSSGWRKAVARDHSHLALEVGIEAAELREIKERRWLELLATTLRELGKVQADIDTERKSVGWKIAIARRLRQESGAPHRWIAQALNMGKPSSVRVYVCKN